MSRKSLASRKRARKEEEISEEREAKTFDAFLHSLKELLKNAPNQETFPGVNPLPSLIGSRSGFLANSLALAMLGRVDMILDQVEVGLKKFSFPPLTEEYFTFLGDVKEKFIDALPAVTLPPSGGASISGFSSSELQLNVALQVARKSVLGRLTVLNLFAEFPPRIEPVLQNAPASVSTECPPMPASPPSPPPSIIPEPPPPEEIHQSPLLPPSDEPVFHALTPNGEGETILPEGGAGSPPSHCVLS